MIKELSHILRSIGLFFVILDFLWFGTWNYRFLFWSRRFQFNYGIMKFTRRVGCLIRGDHQSGNALMKHAFNLALKEWSWVAENPAMKVSMEKEPSSRDRWLTYEEEERLLAVFPQWLREIVICANETGCRREEILSLQWKDVDLFKRVVTIFGKKTGERRTIPLTERVLGVLKEIEKVREKVRSIAEDLIFTYPAGLKVSIHPLRWFFEKALEEAKIDGLRFHDLRHTFASRLAQNGNDPYSIQKLMGHTSFSTTQRYAHHFVESLRRGIVSLEISRKERDQKIITNLSQ